MYTIRQSKKEDLLQKKIVFIFCMVIALLLFIFLFFQTTKTQAASTSTSHKYYTSVRIEAGDTLWELADEYITDEYKDKTEYIQEVCKINHISANDIYAGQYIVLPYYSIEHMDSM